MILFPAIDLKGGECVRLERGDMNRATHYNPDPADQARTFESAGFEWLHLVDLDGAVAGRPVNADAVTSILDAVSIPVQLGGGIRTLGTLSDWLKRGVARAIVGTMALEDPALVEDACRRFPGQVAIAIDARAGQVASEGWAKTSTMTVHNVAQWFEDAGAAAIIYTDIDRDGVMTGLNVRATAALARTVTTPVIASGGVSSTADLRALKTAEDTGIAGAICGRALYDGRLDAAEALAIMAA